MPGMRFLMVLMVIIINALVGIANVAEAGCVLDRMIPAVCWCLAAGNWMAKGFQKGTQSKEREIKPYYALSK